MRVPKLSYLIAGSALLVVGCGRGGQVPASGDSTAATPAAAPAAPTVVTIHATEYAFTGPQQVPAGWTTFQLINDGAMLHHLAIVRLDSGKTVTDLRQALQHPGPPPRWMVPVGGPNAPEPHSQSNATVDLVPGQYAFLCFVDVPGGVPHFAKGMSMPFTVTAAAASSAAAPTPDVVVTLSDYRFDVRGPVTAGRRTFLVQTARGQQPHELELVRLEPGKTPADVVAWVLKPQGPPPGHPLGGAAPAAAGGGVYFTADLTSGKYALMCFVPDAKDGKPHIQHGMVQTLDVT